MANDEPAPFLCAAARPGPHEVSARAVVTRMPNLPGETRLQAVAGRGGFTPVRLTAIHGPDPALAAGDGPILELRGWAARFHVAGDPRAAHREHAVVQEGTP